VKASFLVGSQLGSDDCGVNSSGTAVESQIYVTFKWSATDQSGPVSYDLSYESGAEGEQSLFEGSAQTPVQDRSSNGWDCTGASFSSYQWDLTARDSVGNAVTRVVSGGHIRLTQDNNLGKGSAVIPAIAYAGTWSTATCKCWSAGATHKTTAKGASATATVTVPDGEAAHLALVMETGPNRGKFQVSIDGVLKATVDSLASVSSPRTSPGTPRWAAGPTRSSSPTSPLWDALVSIWTRS
jgi:hypothetical protein